MSTPPAGTTQKRLFSRNDYLAPLPIPTGEKPCDVLNTIWRKNDVFVDIGNYSIGSAVMVIWTMGVFFALMSYITPHPLIWGGGLIIVGIPILFVIQGLFHAVPLPVRFNRQRREVCVPRGDDEYWIVPWESVTAAATQQSSVSQAGRATMGLLIIGFENPDPQAKDDNKHFSFGFNCGGGTTAMALWECIRSYMEIGPQAVPDSQVGIPLYEETQIGSIITDLRKGDLIMVVWGIFCITILGTYLAEKLQNLKLSHPPELPYPDIIEWSKPLPPEQWAKRSAELETAIAKREAELAVQTTQASEDRP
ncbi:hypothetical protein [Pseudomonas extremaustralis]|uniref:Uncharacterized protein n=1 Tax=Pseudomonas extremaustralis TaxID=359110 RepID=A0A5C5QQ26_9PSED|nr:hypothetical protein [Pseudomonas extremaustralis]EZI24335.1 hypothetical protein PE143B_0128030 [Pseudomonas extremaustralis 14-3 substr. 14-3b]TWS07208.1 hypothetical protein FIV36_00175 [Pseudomonas extremaustralis]SDE72105.1 hypothetical protein SAMN05216591_0736 [Pseudomonas extremaustralis]